ncbi:MAG: tetratricopeptide repeat protein [Thermoanaerobaculia bacterium]
MGDPLGRLASEEEIRRRLARGLHDDHCQRLAALGFELRAVRNRLDEGDPRRGELDGLGERLGELGEDLRQLSHDLHPAILERRGLVVALRDQVAEVAERQGLRVELELPEAEPALPPEVALALYRIAQEGLANILRHAGVPRARLSLEASRSAVQLTLSDEGAGFEPEAARRADGLGLASMEERARLLGGRLRIRSAPGAGTMLVATVPRRRLSRWARRHRRWLAAAGLVAAAVAGGFAAVVLEAHRAEAEARRAEAAVRFLEGLFSAADPGQARGHTPDARELLSRGRERLSRELGDQPLLRARLLDTLGGIYTELGLYPEARPLLEEALGLRKRLQGEEHPAVAATLARLARLANRSGEGDAVDLFRQALALAEKHPGRDPAAFADLLNDLGTTLAGRNRFGEAEPVLRRALALQESLFGAQDPRVARTLHNLSGIAYYQGRIEESERLLLRALAIRQQRLPEDDPELAGSREALALLRLRQGRAAEAAALLERLAATAERVWGPDHPELARTLLNLGKARAALGAKEAALADFSRALGICNRSLTQDHPQRVRALAFLAGLKQEAGRLAEAEPLYRELLALHQQGASYSNWDDVLAQWQELQKAKQAQAATRPAAPP